MNIEKGKRYRVKSDDARFFQPGDIVIALQSGDACPYCTLAENYVKGLHWSDYSVHKFNALIDNELEEICENDKSSIKTELTRGECENAILEKIKEIREIVKQYEPKNNYFTLCIFEDNDYISFTNYPDGGNTVKIIEKSVKNGEVIR